MSLDLSGALNSIAGDLPTAQTLLTSLVTGALANTVITGVKNGGLASIDVLGILPKPSQTPAPGNNVPPLPQASATHPSVPLAVFNVMTPAQQAGFWAAGGTISQ